MHPSLQSITLTPHLINLAIDLLGEFIARSIVLNYQHHKVYDYIGTMRLELVCID